MTRRVAILGVQIDAVTMHDAIDVIRHLIARGRPAFVFSLNVDILMKVTKDPELKRIYDAAELVLVDGTPMMWAARFLGSPLPERVSGSDFIPVLSRAIASEARRLFLLGGVPGVAETARVWLEQNNPGLVVVDTYSPPFGFEHDADECAGIVSRIRAAKPDLLLVALGAPKEQKWLHRYRNELQVPVSIGVGSALDYLAGRLRRAPRWMQRAGLEWSFRLLQEPHRLWRRYLIEDPPFIFHILVERLRRGAPR
jgi:N-acetylglucosaminyldiphosphoundecaprenol N-acetyl-beta-D-mannosaminyltransferase